MADGRMLKRAVSDSRRLSELKTDSARLLWTWILPYLDIEGRFFADPDIIKGKVVPRLKTFTPANVFEYLKDMNRVGLITLYEHDGEKYMQFRNFREFQNLRENREGKSKIPPPGALPEHSRNTPIEAKLSEVKLSEVNISEVKATPERPKPVDNSTPIHDTKPALIEEPQPKEPDALLSDLREVAEEIGTLMPDANKQRQMMLFVESNIRGSNHSAIIHCLKSMRDQLKKGDQIEKPRAYLEATLKIENGKHNARENEQRSNQFKVSAFNMSCIGDIFRKAAQSTP